uniref:Uncharacterized protein n=1 Tax=Corynebacterium silvaticum TaxID=2320431 RepID=A0A7U5HL87_9CORY
MAQERPEGVADPWALQIAENVKDLQEPMSALPEFSAVQMYVVITDLGRKTGPTHVCPQLVVCSDALRKFGGNPYTR